VWLAVAGVLAVWLRRPWVVAAVLAAMLAADLSSRAIKTAVDRERPGRALGVDTLIPTPHDASFPSGHASTSFAAAAVFVVLWPRYAWAFVGLATAISFSRLYVGVHFPLDVLGGAALGALVATALLLLARSLRPAR
jgi:membrane-associated phospholipid phosphatase